MTIFTKIIAGEIPGRFVWADDDAVAFADVEPHRPGHVLVVPREPVDKFTDLSDELAARLFVVAKRIGNAQIEAFDVSRAMLVIAGLGVPHTHLHVIPSDSERAISFDSADKNVSEEALEENMTKLREALRSQGWGEFVPEDMHSLDQ